MNATLERIRAEARNLPLEERETLVAVLDFDLRGSNISNEEEGNPETEVAEKPGLIDQLV